jgi:tetratricopeptide (TPR) repeat protein
MRRATLLVGLCAVAACGPPPRPASPSAVQRELAAGPPGPECAAVLARAVDPAGGVPALELLRARARCRAARGEADAAVADARARLEARPDDPQAHVELALALVARSPRALDDAIGLLGRAAGLAPRRADLAYLLGTLLLDDERVDAARPHLERAVALDGRRAGPRLALAQARADRGDAAGARAALAPVPELDPTPEELERGRVICSRLAGWFRGLPADAVAAYRRAAALLDGELPGQAVVALEELVRARPGFAAAHTLLGLAHLKLGNDARAAAALLRAADLNPDDPTNHVYLGLIYLDRGRAEVATAHLDRGLALDPFDARATSALARAREAAGALGEAARLYHRLAVLDGGEPATLRAWARLLKATGDAAGAERVLLRAVAREPSSFEAQLELGAIYQARVGEGQPADARINAERARRHLRRALDLHPGDETARRLLKALEAE